MVQGRRGYGLVGGRAQGHGQLGRAGRAGDGLFGPGDHRAERVDALGGDAFGGDADGQGQAHVVGQGVVGADAATAPAARGALAGVGDQAGRDQAAHALARRGLGDAGRRGQLGPGQPGLPHQRAQHVLVGERAQQLQ